MNAQMTLGPAIGAVKPSARRVLAALEQAGPAGCTTHALCQPEIAGIRFGARIHELRQAGYRIQCSPVRAGSSRYVLIAADAA